MVLFAGMPAKRLVLCYDRSGVGSASARRTGAQRPWPIVPSPFFAVRLAKDGTAASRMGRHRVEGFTRRRGATSEQSLGKPGAAIEHFAGCCNPTNLRCSRTDAW